MAGEPGAPIPTMREMAAVAAADKGIRCPECGCCDFRCYYARRKPNAMFRVKICRHCGRQVRTLEREVGR